MTKKSVYYACLNGNQISDGANLALDNRALWYGDGIFETIAVCQGVPLKPQLHLDRLRIHASQADIEIPWDDEILLKEIYTSATSSLEKAVVRLMIFRGGSLGLMEEGESQRLLIASEARQIPESVYLEGIKLKTQASQNRVNSNRKSLCWADTIVTLRKSAKKGVDDILWLGDQETILEASSSNIFFIGREGDLVEIATPPLGIGILAGTTREVLINLLHSANIPVTVRVINQNELPRFDEAFLTSSIKGLVPVSLIDKKRFYTTRTNATFHHISRLYDAWVNLQIEKNSIQH